MMKNKLFPVLLLMIMLLFSTCKKYEEGPWISFRSKKSRVIGEWEIEEMLLDGISVMDSVRNHEVYCKYDFFEQDGFYFDIDDCKNTNEHRLGSWDFSNDKEDLFMGGFEGDTLVSNFGPLLLNEWIAWKILRLTKKEMWLKTKYLKKEYEVHFNNIKDE